VASEPLAKVIGRIREVRVTVMQEGERNTSIIPQLDNALRYLQMQPPQVEAARRHLVDAKEALVSQGHSELAQTLGELLTRQIMRVTAE
jgi:hypothetical protein